MRGLKSITEKLDETSLEISNPVAWKTGTFSELDKVKVKNRVNWIRQIFIFSSRKIHVEDFMPVYRQHWRE